jgi:hypothetical protein
MLDGQSEEDETRGRRSVRAPVLASWVDEYGTRSRSDRVLSETLNYDDQELFDAVKKTNPEAMSVADQSLLLPVVIELHIGC